jgi:circadian clock protein KaiB
MKPAKVTKSGLGSNKDDKPWNLRLYIAGKTPRSVAALRNLQHLCDVHRAGKYNVEVVDLLKTPRLAAGDQIIAIPTLVRRLPAPLKRVIGDLADVERVLIGLDLC